MPWPRAQVPQTAKLADGRATGRWWRHHLTAAPGIRREQATPRRSGSPSSSKAVPGTRRAQATRRRSGWRSARPSRVLWRLLGSSPIRPSPWCCAPTRRPRAAAEVKVVRRLSTALDLSGYQPPPPPAPPSYNLGYGGGGRGGPAPAPAPASLSELRRRRLMARVSPGAQGGVAVTPPGHGGTPLRASSTGRNVGNSDMSHVDRLFPKRVHRWRNIYQGRWATPITKSELTLVATAFGTDPTTYDTTIQTAPGILNPSLSTKPITSIASICSSTRARPSALTPAQMATAITNAAGSIAMTRSRDHSRRRSRVRGHRDWSRRPRCAARGIRA